MPLLGILFSFGLDQTRNRASVPRNPSSVSIVKMNKSKSCRVLICNNSFQQNINAYSDYSSVIKNSIDRGFLHTFAEFSARGLCVVNNKKYSSGKVSNFRASLSCSDWLVAGNLVSPLAPLALCLHSTLEYEAGYEADSVKAQSSDKNRPLVGLRTPTSTQLTI